MTVSVNPKVGVIFKSYEPLASMQAYAYQTEQSKLMGGFWIAEAYHWFRQYGLEARGCFTTLAAVSMATAKIPIGLGITSPYMRHPTIQASEAAGIDELSGGRFIMGIGVGKVGIEYLEYDIEKLRPVGIHRESMAIMRKVFAGEAYQYQGKYFESSMPAFDRAAAGLRTEIPIYVGATGPFMQKLSGSDSDGMLLAGLTSPAFVRYARANMAAGAAKAGRVLPPDFPVGGVILCACSRDGDKARAATRPYTGTYVVNKIRNIKNDVILSGSGLPDSAWEPFRQAIADGTQDNVTRYVTDEMMRKFTVISGTPEDCLEITQELVDAGLNLPLLEVVGASEADNLETIRLMGEEVVPRLRLAA
ncbi:MAG: LLM class flavin-dependent oxidoreductase [Gammaproteobacteria bacterium]|nr:LLM class flavin-dependent oxidoreductase [Gammaproteobacteria bacterium]MCY4209860.1 LLM class flavin-dependent oxidoreductase [Gammaproteobacteria bacterium]MCY4282542.1 LLM class flavin-dependent oxidoreductase [Gammaproteobacteria bacterium]MCY4339220.1 LLM class flavin-dependent oxidoreductase [Gammaproteobacteria bacterium]